MKLLNIPNGITCLNLICGCLAIYLGLKVSIDWACICIILGALFDFFDGMTARALKISSPIGKELDSLADVVTFGVAPSILCFNLMEQSGFSGVEIPHLSLIAFVMAAFSALRLAKFNCDDRQTTSFIGLPTPANALFWVGFYALVEKYSWAECIYFWVAMVFLFSYLMVSEIPMFSLKFANLKLKENYLRYILILGTILFVVFLGFAGLAPTILFYIILSFVQSILSKR